MKELINATYRCSCCGEENEILVDPTAGTLQRYTEDCTVCCRPSVLEIALSADGVVSISAEQEG